MNQISFEWLKILKTRSNFFGLIILLIILFLSVLTSPSNEVEESFRIDRINSNIETTRDAINNMEGVPEASNALKHTEERLELMYDLRKAYESEDNRAITEAEHALEEKQLRDKIEGSLQGGFSLIEQKKLVVTKEYLLENDIEGVNRLFLQVPSINHFYNIFNQGVPSNLIFMIISLILASAYTLEKRKKNIDFLNIVPQKLYRISFSKIFVTTTFALMVVIGSFGVTFLLNGMMYGIGNFDYPLAYSIDGENVLIMNLSTFLLKTILLMIVFILFLSVLSFLISLFTGSILVNAIILIGIILTADSTLLDNDLIKSIAHTLPFSYVDPANVVQYGSEYKPLANTSVNFKNGILCLGVYTIVIMLISQIIIWKKGKL